ncbi:hypothetical protein PG993_006194 [Apiospora rasikravindrae]|uniref:Chromatin target of PRMT1 protein C-terminal domain-containing protein n=1 Tax=Apiospora rasikravindrae TaxID=990691 RepID=A0ABR1T506_9PEZI
MNRLAQAKAEPDIECSKSKPKSKRTLKSQSGKVTNGTKRAREEDPAEISSNYPIPQRRRLEAPAPATTPNNRNCQNRSQDATIDGFTFPRPDVMIATVPNDNARRAAVNMFFNRQPPEYPFTFEMRMLTQSSPLPNPVASFYLTPDGMKATAWGYDGLRATIDKLAESHVADDDRHTAFHVQISGVTQYDSKRQTEALLIKTNRLSSGDIAAKPHTKSSIKNTNNANGNKGRHTNRRRDKAKTARGVSDATKPPATPGDSNALRTLDGNIVGRQKAHKDKKDKVLQKLDQDMMDYWAHGPAQEDKDIKVEED